ncbi:pyroglutamyl-peptidase [Rhodopseudomonas julia]|uniref:Pyrrolidone-carboxylate peptidase n=1 Tax=Rhodopseudomonas julia TaxID=200617 RepID=A0ABU0C5B6_9BRAD|nr:pyroglutamyl-peptidase I [Rhodopseudomonas julia]MDQ0325707.1 pyroglutamyl-peptidase [Rhodopseudomonas julia]
MAGFTGRGEAGGAKAGRPRLLVTGFGPFPGVEANPSAWLVERLADEADGPGLDADLRTAVLATDWQEGPRALDLLWQAHHPDVVVHFGVAAEARGFRLERMARNARLARPDVRGALPQSAELDEAGPSSWRGSLPLRRIHAALASAGIPADFSDDAGDYLCNAIFYRSGRYAAEAGRLVMAGFIHLPFCDSAPASPVRDGVADDGVAGPTCLADEMMLAGARLVLASAIAAWRERAGSSFEGD